MFPSRLIYDNCGLLIIQEHFFQIKRKSLSNRANTVSLQKRFKYKWYIFDKQNHCERTNAPHQPRSIPFPYVVSTMVVFSIIPKDNKYSAHRICTTHFAPLSRSSIEPRHIDRARSYIWWTCLHNIIQIFGSLTSIMRASHTTLDVPNKIYRKIFFNWLTITIYIKINAFK